MEENIVFWLDHLYLLPERNAMNIDTLQYKNVLLYTDTNNSYAKKVIKMYWTYRYNTRCSKKKGIAKTMNIINCRKKNVWLLIWALLHSHIHTSTRKKRYHTTTVFWYNKKKKKETIFYLQNIYIGEWLWLIENSIRCFITFCFEIRNILLRHCVVGRKFIVFGICSCRWFYYCWPLNINQQQLLLFVVWNLQVERHVCRWDKKRTFSSFRKKMKRVFCSFFVCTNKIQQSCRY